MKYKKIKSKEKRMRLTTKIFGEVDIEEEKIIQFPSGIVGFPDLNKFALVHDEEKGSDAPIKWLQSLDEPAFAMPVMNPLLVKEDYNPMLEDELLSPIGGLGEDSTLVLVTLTVPKDIEKMSVNLKAPIIINADSRKATQVILDADEYEVKFPIYQILKAGKEGE